MMELSYRRHRFRSVAKTWKLRWKVPVGDYTTEAGLRFLEERSPLHRADQIVRPLLMARARTMCASKPPNPSRSSRQWQQHGIPVTYVCYRDEGHGLGRPENRRSFRAVAEAFLAAHLGGRCEPVGNDFENSTIEFKVWPRTDPRIGLSSCHAVGAMLGSRDASTNEALEGQGLSWLARTALLELRAEICREPRFLKYERAIFHIGS